MKAAFVICATLAVSSLGASAQAEEIQYSAAYKKCMEATGGKELAMSACAQEETTLLEKKLNDLHKEEIALLDKDFNDLDRDATALLGKKLNVLDKEKNILPGEDGYSEWADLRYIVQKKAATEKAHTAWFAFRDKECQFVYLNSGNGETASRFRSNDCRLTMTAQRLADDKSEVKYSAAFKKCMDSTEGRTFDTIDCITEENLRWDKILNKNYKNLMNSSGRNGTAAQQKAALKEAQRAWLVFREEETDVVYFNHGGGTLSRVAANDSFLELTAKRAIALGKLRIR